MGYFQKHHCIIYFMLRIVYPSQKREGIKLSKNRHSRTVTAPLVAFPVKRTMASNEYNYQFII